MLSIQLRHMVIKVLAFMMVGLNSIIIGEVFLDKIKFNIKKFLASLIILMGVCMIIASQDLEVNRVYIIGSVAFIVASLGFQGKVSHRLRVYVVTLDVLYTCSILVSHTLNNIFNVEHLDMDEKLLFIECISTLMILVLSKMFQNLVFYNKLKVEMVLKRNIIITIMAVIYFLIMGNIDYMLQRDSSMVTNSVVPLLGLYIVAIGGIWCVLTSRYSMHTIYEEEETKLFRKLFKKHLNTYAHINELDREEESLKLEATQGVEALLKTVDEEKLQELKPLVRKIEDKIRVCKSYIVTGNTMIDTLINEKYDIACRHNIQMKVNISLPEDTGVGTVDLCVLLSHTLDYALNRCYCITEEREKSISIEGVWYKGYLMFKLYYTVPNEKIVKGNNKSNNLIKKAIAQDPYGMGAVIKHINVYEGELDLQQCGWGAEKLTFSLNAAGSYAKVVGY